MPRGPVVASDDFNRASIGSNWQQLNPFWGSMQIASSSYVYGTNSGRPPGSGAAARWVGAGTFGDDQWASVSIVALPYQSTQYNIGVICRASADQDGARDFYFALVCADSAGPNYTTILGKVVNGAVTTLHSASIQWSPGDRVELEVEGTTLRLCKNGTPLGGSFTQTDSDLTSGRPGVLGGGAEVGGDNWEAGNIDAGEQPQRPPTAALELVQVDVDAAFARAAVDSPPGFGRPPPQQAASTSVQLAAVEGADSAAASLGLRQGIALGTTEGADTASLQAGLWQSIALAATEGSDAAAFQVGLRQSVALGAAEGSDTAAFQMGFGRQVSLGAAEAADTAAAQVGLRQGVVLGAVEGADAVGLQLGLRQGVALAATEGADTAAFQMGLRQSAALAAVEGADTGSFGLNLDATRTATLGAVEGGDTALCAVFVVPLAQPPVVVVGDGGGRRRRKPRLPEPEPKPSPAATLVDSQELARALAEEGGATLFPQLRSGAGDAKVPLVEDDEIEDLLLLL